MNMRKTSSNFIEYSEASETTKVSFLGSEIPWISCTVGWMECHIDEGVDGNEIEINGNKYQRGIFAHAKSKIRFNLETRFDMFHACVGIEKLDDCPLEAGSVRFLVSGDGNTLVDWQEKSGGEDPTCFDVSINGAKVVIRLPPMAYGFIEPRCTI